ncbi:MAG: ABC transporter permease [Janthinobacterium lividum]
MLKNNFKIAWRSFAKNRQFTFLNLLGLSTGLACALLIYLWVNNELQVDRFHQKDSQLYQVLANMKNSNEVRTIPETNVLLARTLKTEMPEVAYASAALNSSFFGNITLSSKENNIKAAGQFVEPDFLQMFTYPLLHGNLSQVLTEKNSIVISEKLALKLFNTTENLVGKSILWQHGKQYVISGILDDVPASSSVQFDFLIPFENFLDSNPWEKDWGNSDPNTYLVLKKGTNIDRFNQKLAGFIQTKLEKSNQTLFARPYAEGYLFGRYENGVQSGGRIEYVKLFSLIALFILVIACINFMNLSTAKASQRLKEVGIKKAVGASRKSLIMQYLGESVLMTFLSLVIAILILVLVLPQFNVITGKQLSLGFDINLIAAILGVTVITGLLSGSYPALYLSGFNPAVVLKGKLKSSAGELWIRKGLVIFQFTLSVILIIAMLVVYQQIQYIQTKNTGYDKDNILSFNMTGTSPENTNALLAEAKNIPGVVNISSMDHNSLISSFGNSAPTWDGKDPKTVIQFGNIGINYDMIETLGLQIKSGRSFSRKISSDSLEVILNEAAVEAMGIKDPIGKRMDVFGDGRRKIVGVVKNFHFQSLHENVKPFALRLSPNTDAVMAKIKAGTEKQTIDQLQLLYQKYHPGYSFDYRFLDDDYQAQYVSEKRVAILSRYFGGLAILISCLGLFGLAAFTAERRFKEIGIRKVLGASASGVVLLLSKDFLKLVFLAVVIAFPLSWLAMNQWLKGFAYRTSIHISIFLIAGIPIILITLFTVSFQAVKAALANPVKSLRSE